MMKKGHDAIAVIVKSVPANQRAKVATRALIVIALPYLTIASLVGVIAALRS
jgi:hypothetical protein